MGHCIHQWLMQKACWVHCQGLTTLHKLCSYCEHVRHQWCIAKKLGQILVRSWISHPEPSPSRCQCTITLWGTVFTNDCCSRLVGSITKVWQPFTSWVATVNMSDINDVSPKSLARFWSYPEILALNQVDVSAPSWYEVLYSPMIVAVGLLGPLPRSDNPSQAE